MNRYDVTITGLTPLLMHADDVEWADKMDAWKADPANRKRSKAGDDRSPAWRWIGGLYMDDEVVGVPSDNLMRCLMEGGAMVPVPGGRSGKTFKAQTQSGLQLESAQWPLEPALTRADIESMLSVPDFGEHKRFASAHGFRLFVKRARIGQQKHIRVRARFDMWACRGIVTVVDDQINLDVLQSIFDYSGRYKGLGDWRPSSRTPGTFGMFEAKVKKVKKA